MASRIEISYEIEDMRAKVLREKLHKLGFSGVEDVRVSDVYTVDMGIGAEETKEIAGMLTNPVIEEAGIDAPVPHSFDWAIEIGFLPGVTDNVAKTAGQLIEDRLGRKADLCSFWSDLNDDCLIRSGLMSLLENGVQYGQEEENWN